MIGKIFGGAARPFTDTAETYIEQSGQTRRAEVTADAVAEVKRLETTRALQAGQGTWRPLWMHTIRKLLSWYFKMSFAGASIILAMIVSTFVEFTQYSQWAQVKDELVWFLASWTALGGSLITVATWSFLGYSPFRSMYDKNESGESGFKRVVDVVRRKVSPEPTEPAEPVVREAMPEQNGGIERMDGVVVPRTAQQQPQQAAQKVSYNASQRFEWGTSSKRRLLRAHPDLQLLFNWLIARTPYDLGVSETTRSEAKQRENYKRGKSQTMNSRHLERPAMAVDFFVIIDGRANWDIERYREVTDLIKIGAEQLGIPITCGIDWKTLVDGPHVELDRKAYPYRKPDVVLS